MSGLSHPVVITSWKQYCWH